MKNIFWEIQHSVSFSNKSVSYKDLLFFLGVHRDLTPMAVFTTTWIMRIKPELQEATVSIHVSLCHVDALCLGRASTFFDEKVYLKIGEKNI